MLPRAARCDIWGMNNMNVRKRNRKSHSPQIGTAAQEDLHEFRLIQLLLISAPPLPASSEDRGEKVLRPEQATPYTPVTALFLT